MDLTRLPPNLQNSVREYVALVQTLTGPRLRAVTLFGPAVEAGPTVRALPVQSVLVLDEVHLEFVGELGAQGPGLGRLGIQAPLLMTPEYIAASLDTFPIEFLDIRQRHLNILGEDYFAPLKIERPHVRLQLEREFKRELIQIRQGILTAAGRDRALADIYWAAVEHTLLLLRAVLWLHDGVVPVAPAGIVQSAAQATGVDLSALQAALGGPHNADFSALQTLYHGVTALTKWIDELAV